MADPAQPVQPSVPAAAPAVTPPPAVAADTPPAAAAPTPAAAPPASSPESVPVAAPVATPAPAATPAPEAKPAEAAKGAEPEKTPSLLAEAKAEPPKPAEAKPAEAKPEENKPEPPKVPEPIKYEGFKLPEGVTLKDDDLGKYTEILGKHQVPQEAAQSLVDLYVSERQREFQLQRETWERTQQELQAQFKADPEIGGAKWETTIQDCGKVLGWFGQKFGAEHEQNLRQAFSATGLGNHVEFIRLLNAMAPYVAEPGKNQVVTATKPPVTVSKAGRRYANSIPQPNGAA